MHVILRNLCNSRRTSLVLAVVSSAAPALLNKSLADDAAPGAPKTSSRTPKLRTVADLPEDYLGREFTYTARISTNAAWMARDGAYFFIFLEDEEGTKLPRQGFSPEHAINVIRFVLSREDAKRLIEELSATQKYQARIRFRVDRHKGVLGAWCYFGMISSVEIVAPPKQ